MADNAFKTRQDISYFPDLLRKFLEGSVAREVGSPLSIRLDRLLKSSEPRLSEGHLLYLTRLLELVSPTWILGMFIPRPEDEMTEDFFLAFGDLAMDFLEYYVKEDYARMEEKRKAAEMKVINIGKARDMKVTVAKRLVKKMRVKFEKAVKRKETNQLLDITEYSRALKEAQNAVVRMEKEVLLDEEAQNRVVRAEEELRTLEELEAQTKSWYDLMEKQVMGLVKDTKKLKKGSQEILPEDE